MIIYALRAALFQVNCLGLSYCILGKVWVWIDSAFGKVNRGKKRGVGKLTGNYPRTIF